jgi:hypothetical protein
VPAPQFRSEQYRPAAGLKQPATLLSGVQADISPASLIGALDDKLSCRDDPG